MAGRGGARAASRQGGESESATGKRGRLQPLQSARASLQLNNELRSEVHRQFWWLAVSSLVNLLLSCNIWLYFRLQLLPPTHSMAESMDTSSEVAVPDEDDRKLFVGGLPQVSGGHVDQWQMTWQMFVGVQSLSI
jgi:hypothetical protein